MKIRAYPEMYLNHAQAALGDAFDYAVNTCGLSGEDFANMLANGSVGQRIETGDPACVAGKSGIELAGDVIHEATGKTQFPPPHERMERSREYWIGWAAAYYQWFSNRRFSELLQALPYQDMERLYPTLHEADLSKFVEIADRRVREVFHETNLKRIRTLVGCTQAELAQRSGVGLRSIQMYEQRQKEINKAGAETVYRLARSLGCSVEDLLEK